MKTFEKLESLGFFDWLSESHNIKDTDMKPEYLDELPLNDIHRTVANSMAFRWFREKYQLFCSIEYSTTNQTDFVITINKVSINDARDEEYKTYEEAEQACLVKLIKIIKDGNK